MAASAKKRPNGGARSRRSGLPRRSPAQWAVRGILVLLTVACGYYSVVFSLAQVLSKGDPASAHGLAPYDGRITARLAAELTGPKASGTDRSRGGEFARLALRQDPTAVAAASALGVNAQIRNDTAGARRLFAYAEKLSRRDLITQLWAIEDAVARGDVKGALRHYDIALRIKPAMADVLFPVLTAASAEPAIRSELVRTLAAKPAWSVDFVNYTAIHGKNPRAVAGLFQGLRRAGIAVPQTAQAGAVGALLASGAVDQAWSYYASFRPGVDRRRSRDPRFGARLEAPSQLDWVAINDAGVTTTIEPGLFDFSAPASVGGALLQQVQLLPAGDYRLSGHSDGIDQAEGARPYWVLTCRDGRELGRVNMPNSNQAGGNFAGALRVPADCPIQTLVLMARPSEAVGGLSGRIDRVELTPAR